MKSITAIIVIGMLIAFSLYLGYDGVILAAGLAAIAGLGGYSIKRGAPTKKE